MTFISCSIIRSVIPISWILWRSQETAGLAIIQPRDRFVEQKELGTRGKGPGDFNLPLGAVSKVRGFSVSHLPEPQEVQNLAGLIFEPFLSLRSEGCSSFLLDRLRQFCPTTTCSQTVI